MAKYSKAFKEEAIRLSSFFLRIFLQVRYEN